jgi:predicted aspartyl protease
MKLKSISIGGIELKDIDCTIQENGDASLLLGQDVLKKLGEVSIDYKNNKLKIIKYTRKIS